MRTFHTRNQLGLNQERSPNHVLRLEATRHKKEMLGRKMKKRNTIIIKKKKRKDSQALIGRKNNIRWMLRSLQHPTDNHYRYS